MKILNLYACLGGNRYKWDEVAQEAGIDIEVTAVEWDGELAKLYQERFPNDTVIVADAHQYLLDHYQEFDFIWTSPPCPTHSRARYWGHGANGKDAVYPDMTLYEEVIFLEHHCKTKYVVENVIPYYQPLIPAKKRGRHLYWTNFNLPNNINERPTIGIGTSKNEVEKLSDFHDYEFNKYKGKQPLNKIARNLVDYEAGRTIFECAVGAYKAKDTKQLSIL